MEIAQAIKSAETALRDFIEAHFLEKYGPKWSENPQFNQASVKAWRDKKDEVEVKLPPESAEESLLYHIPFDELTKLIHDNWDMDFQAAFGDFDLLKSYLSVLKLYRDSDIHRRSLFVHQKHLVLGVSGEIRSKIAAYRSIKETGKEGFPRIEYIKDNFGNLWVPGKPRKLKTQVTINPGDRLEFIVKAHDPEDNPLEYKIHGDKWQQSDVLFFDIKERHVQKTAVFSIAIRSNRKYHAFPLGYDDRIVFEYQIIPK